MFTSCLEHPHGNIKSMSFLLGTLSPEKYLLATSEPAPVSLTPRQTTAHHNVSHYGGLQELSLELCRTKPTTAQRSQSHPHSYFVSVVATVIESL